MNWQFYFCITYYNIEKNSSMVDNEKCLPLNYINSFNNIIYIIFSNKIYYNNLLLS